MRGGWLLAATLVAGSGCESLNPRTVQIDAASGRFQSAQLTYQLDTARLGQPAHTARVEGRQVSYQQPPRNPLPEASHVRLSIQYPHPRGRAGYALAEAIIESDGRPAKTDASATKSGLQKFVSGLTEAMNDILPGMVYGNGVQEAWALDVPKEDLDQLIGHLANSGYFQYGPPPSSGVEMFTRLDGKIIRKNWRQVPALDAFIERIRQEGKLVSYESPRSSKTAPANVAAGADNMAAYGPPPQGQPAPMSPPPQPYPIANMQPPRPYGPPPQPGPGPMYSSMPPAQNAWPQPTMPQQNVPAGAFDNLPRQQELPQSPSAPAAGAYGSPPQQYGAPAPPQAASPSPQPAAGQPYPNSLPPQPYPQGSPPVGPTAGGGAYPYMR